MSGFITGEKMSSGPSAASILALSREPLLCALPSTGDVPSDLVEGSQKLQTSTCRVSVWRAAAAHGPQLLFLSHILGLRTVRDFLLLRGPRLLLPGVVLELRLPARKPLGALRIDCRGRPQLCRLLRRVVVHRPRVQAFVVLVLVLLGHIRRASGGSVRAGGVDEEDVAMADEHILQEARLPRSFADAPPVVALGYIQRVVGLATHVIGHAKRRRRAAAPTSSAASITATASATVTTAAAGVTAAVTDTASVACIAASTAATTVTIATAAATIW